MNRAEPEDYGFRRVRDDPGAFDFRRESELMSHEVRIWGERGPRGRWAVEAEEPDTGSGATARRALGEVSTRAEAVGLALDKMREYSTGGRGDLGSWGGA